MCQSSQLVVSMGKEQKNSRLVASAFFHGLLTNLLHVTPTNNTNPLVIACCAPGGVHELAPLMFSLLLRRAGLPVAYLGQSIETAGLLQTARQLSPALICVSVTLLSVLEAVIELGQNSRSYLLLVRLLSSVGRCLSSTPISLQRFLGSMLLEICKPSSLS